MTDVISEARAAIHDLCFRAKAKKDADAGYIDGCEKVLRAALDYAETQAAEIERWKSAAAEWQETCENSQKYAQAIIAELKAENQRLKDSEEYTAGDCDEKQTQIDSLKAKLAKAEEVIKPFADAANIRLCGEWADNERFGRTDISNYLTFGHLRAAAQFTKEREGL